MIHYTDAILCYNSVIMPKLMVGSSSFVNDFAEYIENFLCLFYAIMDYYHLLMHGKSLRKYFQNENLYELKAISATMAAKKGGFLPYSVETTTDKKSNKFWVCSVEYMDIM